MKAKCGATSSETSDGAIPLGTPNFAITSLQSSADSERYEYLNELVDFCAEWRKHKCPYALSYYPTHLAELGRNRDLRNLLDKEWMNARWAQTRSHLAFLSDVRLAANSLTVETGSDFADFIQLMMIQASVISLAERIPAEALATLVAVDAATMPWIMFRQFPSPR